MTECIEGGATFAWRLLATLEGGSLLLATSALLVYTARARVVKRRRRSVTSVLVTNTTNTLGKEIKSQLELHGCIVKTLADASKKYESQTPRVAENGTPSIAEMGSLLADSKLFEGIEVDALVVIGADVKTEGLEGVAGLVTEDVYDNLKLLDSASVCVKPGGRIAWACAGVARGSFSVAETAFDAVLQATLQHVATVTMCEAIWVGRCSDAERAAERVVAALTSTTPQHYTLSIRNAAIKASNVVFRWLKIIT